jgi:dnd system-associated protein 4
MIGRVAPPKALEDDLEKLVVADPQGKHPLFETKQKALMFAAALARWRNVQRRAVERKGTAIRYDIFQRALDDGYLDALAIAAHESDLRVLAPDRDDDRIMVFEEYAQAGLEEMIDRYNRPGDPLEAMLALVEEARSEPSDGLEGIDAGALRKLLGE